MSAVTSNAGPRVTPVWQWLLLAFVLLALALAKPMLRMPRLAWDYLFVLDITQSMNVVDVLIDETPVTRLEFAKYALESALRELPCGSRAGLAIFTANRTFVMFTPVEVCEHFGTIAEGLSKIDWRMAWFSRSEVTKGVYSALDAARDIGPQTHLVFLTDGHEAPPLHQSIRPPYRSDRAAVAGFIGGIGGSLPARIPHLSDAGKIIGYWSHSDVMQVDLYSLGRGATQPGEGMVGINMANVARRIALGQEHLSSLREDHLRDLGAQTGLDYLRIDAPAVLLDALTQETYARRTSIASSFAWIPAALAFACLFYCLAVRPWRGSSA